MTLRAVRSGDQVVLTLPAPEVLDQLPIEECPVSSSSSRPSRCALAAPATRCACSGARATVCQQSWEVKLAWPGRKQSWLRLASLALSQWQAAARASAPEPARAREQVGLGA
jgi:hypothetical protein